MRRHWEKKPPLELDTIDTLQDCPHPRDRDIMKSTLALAMVLLAAVIANNDCEAAAVGEIKPHDGNEAVPDEDVN